MGRARPVSGGPGGPFQPVSGRPIRRRSWARAGRHGEHHRRARAPARPRRTRRGVEQHVQEGLRRGPVDVPVEHSRAGRPRGTAAPGTSRPAGASLSFLTSNRRRDAEVVAGRLRERIPVPDDRVRQKGCAPPVLSTPSDFSTKLVVSWSPLPSLRPCVPILTPRTEKETGLRSCRDVRVGSLYVKPFLTLHGRNGRVSGGRRGDETSRRCPIDPLSSRPTGSQRHPPPLSYGGEGPRDCPVRVWSCVGRSR